MEKENRSKLKTCMLWIGGIALGCTAIVGGAYLLCQGKPELFRTISSAAPKPDLNTIKATDVAATLPNIRPSVNDVGTGILHNIRGPLDKETLNEAIVDIAAYKRSLPAGQVASDSAKKLAQAMDIPLGPNETMVSAFSRTQWKAYKGA